MNLHGLLPHSPIGFKLFGELKAFVEEEQPILWVFGDSFMFFRDNWIQQICGDKYRDVICSMGRGSTLYSAMVLDEVKSLIRSDDAVLFGFTSHDRRYFDNTHFSVQGCRQEILEQKATAAQHYYTYLYNEKESVYQNNVLVSHILQNLKSLPTDKVVTLYTLHKEDHINNRLSHNFMDINNFAEQYLMEKTGITNVDKLRQHELWVKYMESPNHWIDERGYEVKFWKYYGELLKKLTE